MYNNALNDERWTVDNDDRPDMSWNRHIVIDGRPHLRVAFMARDKNEEMNVARAYLAAAAPDLLAALDRLLNCVDGAHTHDWLRRCKDQARAAIAKATKS
jgi:hypothetical protein